MWTSATVTRGDTLLTLAVGKSDLTGEEWTGEHGLALAGKSMLNRLGRTPKGAGVDWSYPFQ